VEKQPLPPERLQEEMRKVEQRRDPPVPVWFWLSVDSKEVAGELHGWAANPNGSDDGWRGLVTARREYASGFWTDWIGWVRQERIRQRGA
jgi:hypothetical protein